MVTKITPKFGEKQKWHGASLEVRLQYFDSIYVRYTEVKLILDYLERELVRRAADRRTSGLLVIAPPGAGKTTLIKQLLNLYPPVITDELTTRPVVAFKVPPAPTLKTMGAELLRALGDPRWDRDTASVKFDRAKLLLVEVGTKLILIDDFQDVPLHRKSRGVQQIAAWLRDLCDIPFGGVVVAVGTAEATMVRDGNPQIQRRMQARLDLPVFAGETKEELLKFAGLLKKIDEALPLTEISGLFLGDLPKRLHIATLGNLDYLTKLLKKAVEKTMSRGAEQMTRQDLREAFQEQHQVYSQSENPFDLDFRWTDLAQPGQVFHNVDFNISPQEAKVSA